MAEIRTLGRRVRALAALAGAIAQGLNAVGASAAELNEAEARGLRVYFDGVSPSGGTITAHLRENDLELPGESATCGSCHGHDGSGRPESGVKPSNIRWTHLVRPYGHLHEDGLEHGPFDEKSLAHYLRSGVYPGGATGDPAMPYYEIPEADLRDLIAFMKRVGEVLDPGVGDRSIRLATVVPAAGPAGEIGAVIRDVLSAYFAEVNGRGGVYGRRLELAVCELAEGDGPDALTRWLDSEKPFAIVSPFTPRQDMEMQSAIASAGVPLVGPLTLYSLRSFVLNRSTFYLYPSLVTQLEALLRFAAGESGLTEARVAVLHPDAGPGVELVEPLQKAAEARGWKAVRGHAFSLGALDAEAASRALRAEGAEVLISLGGEADLVALLKAAAAQDWNPYVLAPGALSGGALHEAPAPFEDRLFLAYPTLPQDRKPAALGALSRILEGNERARNHVQAVVSAYSSAVVLVEALRRAGRELGRLGLVAELEHFYAFETGLTPPVTFTPNRRIGAQGAYVLRPADLDDGHLPDRVRWVDSE